MCDYGGRVRQSRGEKQLLFINYDDPAGHTPKSS